MLLVLTFLAAMGTPLQAQQTTDETESPSITGVVLDRSTRQPIPAANVVLVGQQRGAAADMDGRFAIVNLTPGTYHLTASALSYEPQTLSEITVTPGRPAEVEFLLQPSAVQAKEVVFTTSLFENPSTDLPTSSRSLRYEEVRRAPGGIEDIQRTLQALPGVVGANDQSNQIIVRGGAPDENLTLIDGLEIENTNHFSTEGEGNGGAINALNTEFLRDVTFAAGGFSARYGDRLSSVLDLDLREGRRDRFGGAADFNMSGAGGHLEGPIGERGSVIASVHRSFLELLPSDAVGLATVPWYWNTQAHVDYDLSDRHLLTVNGLYLHDEQVITPADTKKEVEENGESINTQNDGLDYTSGRYLAGARLRSLWGHGYTDLIIGRSWNRRNTEVIDADEYAPDQFTERTVYDESLTEINDQLGFHYNGRAFNQDSWSAGVSVKPQRWQRDVFAVGDSIIFDDGYLSTADGVPDTFYYDDQLDAADKTALKTGAYTQYNWRPNNTLSFTGGLRYDGLDVSSQHTISPRLAATWQFIPRWTLSLAWGQYTQSQNLGLYLDPASQRANEDLAHKRVYQYVAGLRFLPRASTLLSVEGYYKEYDNLPVREEDIVREQTGDRRYDSEAVFTSGTGQAWGIELFAHQKLASNWYGTLSYSYGKSETTDDAFGTYPSDFDFTHVATAVLGYKTNLIQHEWYRDALRTPWLYWLWAIPLHGDQLTVSSRYRFMSGRPYTKQVWYDEGEASPDPIYEGHWEDVGHNNMRYPYYERWDIRIDNKYTYTSSALVLYLEVQNVSDRINVAEYYFQDNGTRDTIEQFRQF